MNLSQPMKNWIIQNVRDVKKEKKKKEKYNYADELYWIISISILFIITTIASSFITSESLKKMIWYKRGINTNHTKTIQVRRTRHAGHCWRSRDELIRDVLLWIPTHGRAKAGRPARTYIQQLCEDTGCCPEDLPRAMNDREEWRERVRDIRAASTIWWWWWWWT